MSMNDHNICYVVGAMSLTPDLRPYPAPGDFVIAADRGFDSLMAYGVVPNLAVGDFDSLGHIPDHNNVITLPVEKDDTDMAFAVSKGLEMGYKRFVLLGGVGGRLDHTLQQGILLCLPVSGLLHLLPGSGSGWLRQLVHDPGSGGAGSRKAHDAVPAEQQ